MSELSPDFKSKPIARTDGLSGLFSKFRIFLKNKSQKKHPWFWVTTAFLLFVALFFVSGLSTLRIFLPHFNEVTGFPFSDKNYLIVFQNNNELRPAGGFISSYGVLKFKHGFYAGLNIADVYGEIANHPYIKPPYPMELLLADRNYQGYTFRDANYQPDYPKTAQELVRMLHLTRPDLQIDGVIAVNYTFLEDLLQTIGPVRINTDENPSREIIFSKDNLFEKLSSQVHNVDLHDLEQLQHRKNILALFADALFKKIFWNPFGLRKISDTMVRNLTLKNIQLYFNDQNLEKIVTNYGWAGQWPAVLRGDFLAVNEANLGGMKSDRYIQRKISYHLKLVSDKNSASNQNQDITEKFKLIAEVTIDLFHYGIENIPLSGDYKGFFRTYVPRGAKLLEVATNYRKDLWESDEDLFHIFGNIVKLKPGEKTQLYYRYEIPETLLHDNDYHLFLLKQSGTSQDDYTVTIEAPQGYSMSSSSMTSRENLAIFDRPLQTDTELDAQIMPDSNPPYLIYQEIENILEIYSANSNKMGQIVLAFNEEIADKEIKDLSNFKVEDSDKKHPELHDELKIDHIEHSGKRVTIYVQGMTRQTEEFYTVTIKNLADLHGNLISPNPLVSTVVQR